jgi:hypothetical protein
MPMVSSFNFAVSIPVGRFWQIHTRFPSSCFRGSVQLGLHPLSLVSLSRPKEWVVLQGPPGEGGTSWLKKWGLCGHWGIVLKMV